jgi:hypothetical protein
MTTATRTRLNSLGEDGSGCPNEIIEHENMGLDVLVWGFAVAVFGVAFRRALDMSSQQRWRSAWFWYFVSFVPLGLASQVWVAMNNPTPTVRWLILGFAGAALGATAFIAIGEFIRSQTGHPQLGITDSQPSALAINVGDTEPYKVPNISDGNSREVVRVEVANISERHLAGCRLEMESMEPDDVAGPTVLRENFSLAPGGRNHTDVALLDTIVGDPASTIMFILSSGVRVPLRDDSYILRFRATATASSECISDCQLRIDAGALRLQKIS